jgi:tRNA threonylcarbamoyl adenosine modification protein YeaZ
VPVVLALVIDTSSAAVTAAVVRIERGANRDEVVAERVTIDARAHAELLAPSIAACLHEAGITPVGLGAVIAGLGPGPFTGLRVGLVTAAAMADALHLPAYGVCSLDAIAAELAHSEALLVAGDARRREVYWATYAGGVSPQRVFPESVSPGSVFSESVSPDAGRQAGPDVARAADLVAAGVAAGAAAMTGAGARLYQAELALPLLEVDYPTARGLARLATARVLADAPGETLVPLYLRRPDAVAATSFKAVTP